VLHPRRQPSSHSSLWESQILCKIDVFTVSICLLVRLCRNRPIAKRHEAHEADHLFWNNILNTYFYTPLLWLLELFKETFLELYFFLIIFFHLMSLIS
jgi:hypothetical protein